MRTPKAGRIFEGMTQEGDLRIHFQYLQTDLTSRMQSGDDNLGHLGLQDDGA